MKVFAKTDDFAAEVDAHGLENVVAEIHAQVLRDRQPKDEDSLRVILDGKPPEFEATLVSGTVEKGKDIQVVARVIRTLSDIRKFEFGFQGDAEQKFKDKTKVVEPRGQSAAVALSTKDLDPGEYTVLMRSENKAGNFDFRGQGDGCRAASTAQRETVDAQVDYDSRDGQVARRQRRPARVDREPRASAVADAEGKFTFSDLPRCRFYVKAKDSTGSMMLRRSQSRSRAAATPSISRSRLSSLNHFRLSPIATTRILMLEFQARRRTISAAEDLASADFSERSIPAVLARDVLGHHRQRGSRIPPPNHPNQTPLDTLIRLLFIGLPVPAQAVREALQPMTLEAWTQAGLLCPPDAQGQVEPRSSRSGPSGSAGGGRPAVASRDGTPADFVVPPAR